MKNKHTMYIIVTSLLVFLTAYGLYAWQRETGVSQAPSAVTEENGIATSSGQVEVEVVAEGLEIPWDIAFLPDESMLVTERPGRVVHIESGRVFPVEGVRHVGEAGLLGIALHPNFSENSFVYLYQTVDTTDGGVKNQVVRYTYTAEEFLYDTLILDNIPAARNHDGGRIAFGPDSLLYVTVGDAQNKNSAQDTAVLSGSILRVRDDGSIPEDNPFGNAVYSYGHRNPQGLTWDDEGRLWSTEHGRSGLRSGYDEINNIVRGANYGWPKSEGDTVVMDTVAPVLHSTATETWAPASAEFYNGRIFFGGLRGEALYEAVLEGDTVVELRQHLKKQYGRIRTVRLGPDGYLYLTTSNRDGRGVPTGTDDRIIRIHPDTL